MGKKAKWIKRAIEKPGALTDYIKRKFGARGFTKRGTIKVSVLRDLLSMKRVRETTKRRARLALKFRGLKKKRKS